MEVVWIGLGGAVGANARYLVGRWALERLGGGFPFGTLAANLIGCFLIGVVMATLMERAVEDQTWRLLLVVGVLGGYTTFSSFAFEAVTLLEQGRFARAAAYVLASNAGGLAACAIGLLATRAAIR
jgi:CrcB protein